jgi:tetratricopeptide (TPR) repeat protein
MRVRNATAAAICVACAGCVTPPAEAPADARPPDAPIAGSPAPEPPPSAGSPLEALEEQHRALAQSRARERNWADALVQWELLLLLKPESREYRNAVEETRKHIRSAAAQWLPAADLARRQGNLDQAILLYLRVLQVDRDNAAAAQALRDIDAERTRRAYIHRPPRGSM